MNINLTSSAEEIILFLNIKDKIQLLNGQLVSPLWVPSDSFQSVKKFLNNNVDKWSREKEYQEPETFDFYEAMKRVYKGKKIIPIDWRGLSDYFYLDEEDGYVKTSQHKSDSWPLCKSFFERKWKEFKEQPKTFGWDEAYRLMKEGNKVARAYWSYKGAHYKLSGDKMSVQNSDGNDISLYIKDLDATDWYIYEE